MNRVLVIGDGGWGTALAILLHNNGIKPVLWSYSPEYAEYLDRNRDNTKFLEGIRIPNDIIITSDTKQCEGMDYAVFVVPCEHLRSVADRFKDVNFGKIISATKGIENSTLLRPTEIISEYFSGAQVGVISGPSISVEVAKNHPAAVVFASSGDWGKDVQGIFSQESFRVYTSSDVVGVEIGGSVKNVIAIAAGISDGLGFGANAKAAILTRGLAEIIRLGKAMGASEETFIGLSGIGDLATTCMSLSSRNRSFGEQLGKGGDPEDILKGTEMVFEGVKTSKSVKELAEKYSVEMPITDKIYEIIYEGKDPQSAVKELMMRDLKAE